MRPNWFQVALLVVVAALAGSLFLGRGGERAASVDDPWARLEQRMIGLEQRIDELATMRRERSTSQGRGDEAPASVAQVAGSSTADRGADGAAADQRVQRIQLVPTGPLFDEHGQLTFRPPYSHEDLKKPEKIDEIRGLFRDASRNDDERIQALRYLQAATVNGFPRDQAFPDDFVTDVLTYARDAEAGTRRHALANLNGLKNAGLDKQFQYYLENDSDRRVREQAARNLAAFRETPGVAQALERSAYDDPEEEVRARALEALGKK